MIDFAAGKINIDFRAVVVKTQLGIVENSTQSLSSPPTWFPESRAASRSHFVFKGPDSHNSHPHHSPMRGPIIAPIPADGGFPSVAGIEP